MLKQITTLHQLPLANIPRCLTRVCHVPSILPALYLAEKAAVTPAPWVVCPEFFHLSLFTELKSIRIVLLKIWKMKSCAINLIGLLIQMLTTVASSSFWMLGTVITVCRRLLSSPKMTLLIIYRIMHCFLYFTIFLCFSWGCFMQFFLTLVPAHSHPRKKLWVFTNINESCII